ncbi:MAG: flagellar protein FlgN [Planctomycetota bacterium]
MNSHSQDLRLRACGEDLCETLDRLHDLHRRLQNVLTAKEEALVAVEMDRLAEVQKQEEEILHSVVAEEKHRLVVTEEIGDLIGFPRPSSVRVSDMLEHMPGEVGSRLHDSRSRLREIARSLAERNRATRALIEHSLGHIQVFLSKLVNEEMLGVQYGADGTESSGDGSSILMDRTG